MESMLAHADGESLHSGTLLLTNDLACLVCPLAENRRACGRVAWFELSQLTATFCLPCHKDSQVDAQ